MRPIIVDRNERRNITVGQKAMGYAMLFPEPEKLKHRGSGSISGKPENTSKGHWQNLVSQARAVRRETPELAIKVRDGFPLNKAFAMMLHLRGAPTS
jgi:hypothetical protein